MAGCNEYAFSVVRRKTLLMRKLLYCLVAVLLCTGIGSCKKSASDTHSSLDENLKISMRENIKDAKRTLSFYVTTEKTYPCSNYSIETSTTTGSDKIVISFIKINTPGICLTSLGPATAVIALEGLSARTYTLELHTGNDVINGQLTVSADQYVLTLPVQTKIESINPQLNRIPENTIFGTVHYHHSTTVGTVNKFIDSLQYFGAATKLYLPGDYQQFQIEANGQVKQVQDMGYYFTRYFIFHYAGDVTPLKNLVQRYGVTYKDSLLATINTSKGEVLYSWNP